MILNIAAQSDTGCARANNEDIALVQSEFVVDVPLQMILDTKKDVPVVLAVADGMGGHEGGEIASQIAVEKFAECRTLISKDSDYQKIVSQLETWVAETNRLINEVGNKSNSLKGMGTTFVGLVFTNASVMAVNIGDSRLYLYRDGWLRQITNDHSLQNLNNDSHIPSNIIYNSLGTNKIVFADYFNLDKNIQDKDVFLLCSDGLSGMISEESIEQILKNGGSTQQLIDAAKKAGGKDNITALLIWVNDERQQ